MKKNVYQVTGAPVKVNNENRIISLFKRYDRDDNDIKVGQEFWFGLDASAREGEEVFEGASVPIDRPFWFKGVKMGIVTDLTIKNYEDVNLWDLRFASSDTIRQSIFDWDDRVTIINVKLD